MKFVETWSVDRWGSSGLNNAGVRDESCRVFRDCQTLPLISRQYEIRSKPTAAAWILICWPAMAVPPTSALVMRYTCSQLLHIRPTPWNVFKRVHGIGPASRHLSVTVGRQWANKKTQLSPIAKTASKTIVPASLPHKAYRSFADTLALRSSPILLYQSPSHAVYITGCWLVGGFCMTWATFNFYIQYLDPIKGTPEWIPVLMGGVCVATMCLGTWVILRVWIQMSRPC